MSPPPPAAGGNASPWPRAEGSSLLTEISPYDKWFARAQDWTLLLCMELLDMEPSLMHRGRKEVGWGGPSGSRTTQPEQQPVPLPPHRPTQDTFWKSWGPRQHPPAHSVSAAVNASPCSDLTEQEPGAGANDRGRGHAPQDPGLGRGGMMTRVGCPRLTASSLGQSPDVWCSSLSMV